ncbi:hypothetical protein AB3S75_047034 [Citrus x aurantiifolia]
MRIHGFTSTPRKYAWMIRLCMTDAISSRRPNVPARGNTWCPKSFLCVGGGLRLIGYSDADWGADLNERKSTSGYAFLPNRGAIT